MRRLLTAESIVEVASLPDAADYDGALVRVTGDLFFSNGSAWVMMGGGGGGGVAWSAVSANTAMAADSAYIVTGARDMTLPAGVTVGQQFIVHAATATVRIVSNGNVIAGVGSGNDLTIAEGETAYLVGSSTGNLEIV